MRNIFLYALLCVGVASSAQVQFPLHTSGNQRHLVDAAGKPFPILGRTSWCILSQPEQGYKQYIENTVSHGYNAIEVAIIFHWLFTNHSPFNGNMDAPF